MHVQDGEAQFPSVGRLIVAITGQNAKQCTGALVGAAQILTAAHCVHGDLFVGSFSIFFGQVAADDWVEEAVGQLSACQIPPQFLDDNDPNQDQYDWAYCNIVRSSPNENVVPIALAISVTNPVDITIVGYPAAEVDDHPTDLYPVSFTPYVEDCTATFVDNVWRYQCSTDEAMSGSPLCSSSNNVPVVVGNHAGAEIDIDFNYGVFSLPTVATP